jgi:hypothetical protein
MREQGHDKFSIYLISTVEVDNLDQLRQQEQEHIQEYDSLTNGLNQRYAYQTPERQIEISRNGYLTQKAKPDFKEKKNTYRNKLRSDTPRDKYKCETCNYNTNRLDSYTRHLNCKQHVAKDLGVRAAIKI